MRLTRYFIGLSRWDGETKCFAYETEDGEYRIEYVHEGRIKHAGGRSVLCKGWRVMEKIHGSFVNIQAGSDILEPSLKSAMATIEERRRRGEPTC